MDERRATKKKREDRVERMCVCYIFVSNVIYNVLWFWPTMR